MIGALCDCGAVSCAEAIGVGRNGHYVHVRVISAGRVAELDLNRESAGALRDALGAVLSVLRDIEAQQTAAVEAKGGT